MHVKEIKLFLDYLLLKADFEVQKVTKVHNCGMCNVLEKHALSVRLEEAV